MKKYLYLCPTLALALLASCSNEIGDTGKSDTYDGVAGAICTIPTLIVDSDYDDDTDITRSSLALKDGVMNFTWDIGEKITVYSGGENKGDFTLESVSEDGKTGVFTGGGFSLTAGKEYYTISKSSTNYGTEASPKYNIPKINDKYTYFNADAYTNIKMSYDGQRQTVNGGMGTASDGVAETSEASAHLGAYDYLTAVATATTANSCHFQYKRMGVILRIVLKGLPADVAYKKLTMYDASEDMLREMNRVTNITNGNTSAGYSPYFNDVELDSNSKRFTVMLGTQDKNGNEQGISVEEGKSLVVYMMIPPIDLTNKTCAFRLVPVDETNNKTYFGTYKRTKAFTAGTTVPIALSTSTGTLAESTVYNINIQVMHDWAKGNTQNVEIESSARANATGDPGNAKESPLPTYLYTFFVNNGRLVQMASATPESTDWTTSNNVSTLKNTVQWSVTTSTGTQSGAKLTLDNTNKTNPRVYVVASDKEITTWKDASGKTVSFNYSAENGTEESVIQGLSYNYVTDGTATDVFNKDDIKSLYSTAFVNDNTFAGTLGDDVKDVRLYHVASKLDINWENTKTTGSYSTPVPLSGSVSVNNIPTTNLSFFKPTTNAAGTTSVFGDPITTSTAYNGRQVWYVPQVYGATYNVTIGSKTQDIKFTPDDTYTSWFRGLVTIK